MLLASLVHAKITPIYGSQVKQMLDGKVTDREISYDQLL
uniref:Uncharacterized protein n=1 Tax=Providencia rettgeri TaxID=587 RepID=A0A3G2CDA3_PRORE|nr:Hypothetical protein [Providencia rettgeri]